MATWNFKGSLEVSTYLQITTKIKYFDNENRISWK